MQYYLLLTALADVQAMVSDGATRIGASADVAIVNAERGESVGASGKGY